APSAPDGMAGSRAGPRPRTRTGARGPLPPDPEGGCALRVRDPSREAHPGRREGDRGVPAGPAASAALPSPPRRRIGDRDSRALVARVPAAAGDTAGAVPRWAAPDGPARGQELGDRVRQPRVP